MTQAGRPFETLVVRILKVTPDRVLIARPDESGPVWLAVLQLDFASQAVVAARPWSDRPVALRVRRGVARGKGLVAP